MKNNKQTNKEARHLLQYSLNNLQKKYADWTISDVVDNHSRSLLEEAIVFGPKLSCEAAKMIIRRGQAEAIARNLWLFNPSIHIKLAFEMIEYDQAEPVAAYLSLFEDLDPILVAKEIVYTKQAHIVCRYLANFPSDCHNLVAREILKSGQANILARYLYHFIDLEKEIALNLIQEGHTVLVLRHLSTAFRTLIPAFKGV